MSNCGRDRFSIGQRRCPGKPRAASFSGARVTMVLFLPDTLCCHRFYQASLSRHSSGIKPSSLLNDMAALLQVTRIRSSLQPCSVCYCLSLLSGLVLSSLARASRTRSLMHGLANRILRPLVLNGRPVSSLHSRPDAQTDRRTQTAPRLRGYRETARHYRRSPYPPP